MAHFRFSHPSTPRVRIIQVAPPRKGPSTSAGQGRPHSNKPAGQPGRAGSAAPTPPPHSRSSGHGTHHSVRHTQLHNITTAAPNNTRRGIITMVISPLSVSRGSFSGLASLEGRQRWDQEIPPTAIPRASEQASRAAAAPSRAAEKGTPTPASRSRCKQCSPPKEGAWIANTSFPKKECALKRGWVPR